MRFVVFGDFTLGVLREGEVVDLSPALEEIPRLPWDDRVPAMIASYERLRPGIERLAREGSGVPVSSVRLRAPNPRPGKFLCTIGNYRKASDEEPGMLDFFFKSPESVIGPGDTVVLPEVEASMYQGEASLAIVLGRQGKNVREEEAGSYIFGYTGFIDVFGRDVGRPVGTYWAKSFDTFGPMGPCIVTPDELRDPHALEVRLSVNGQPRQGYSTSAMAHRDPAVVATATAIMTLYPGDMLGCGSDQQGAGPLSDGDDVRMEIEGIGSLDVRVSDPLRRSWPQVAFSSGGQR